MNIKWKGYLFEIYRDTSLNHNLLFFGIYLETVSYLLILLITLSYWKFL